jgi:hypothetical protein
LDISVGPSSGPSRRGHGATVRELEGVSPFIPEKASNT